MMNELPLSPEEMPGTPEYQALHEERTLRAYRLRVAEWLELEEPDYDDEDYEPTDYEMMSAFGTKWHDGL